MILGQRAYEANSKVIRAADEMLQQVNGLGPVTMRARRRCIACACLALPRPRRALAADPSPARPRVGAGAWLERCARRGGASRRPPVRRGARSRRRSGAAPEASDAEALVAVPDPGARTGRPAQFTLRAGSRRVGHRGGARHGGGAARAGHQRRWRATRRSTAAAVQEVDGEVGAACGSSRCRGSTRWLARTRGAAGARARCCRTRWWSCPEAVRAGDEVKVVARVGALEAWGVGRASAQWPGGRRGADYARRRARLAAGAACSRPAWCRCCWSSRRRFDDDDRNLGWARVLVVAAACWAPRWPLLAGVRRLAQHAAAAEARRLRAGARALPAGGAGRTDHAG